MRFLDTRRVFSNMKAVTRYLTGTEAPGNSLKRTFIDALNAAQATTIRTLDEDIYVEFENQPLVDLLTERTVFARDEVLNGAHLLSDQERKQINLRLAEAKSIIAEADSNLYCLLVNLIGSVAAYHIPRRDGGSVSCCIGLIWLSPKEDWTTDYYAEMLVHELVHNIVFLEDMVQGVMPEPTLLERSDALSISAIRQTRRPYDKAFHSACVTAAIMYLYQVIGKQEQANRHITPLRRTIIELRRSDQALKNQGLNLLTDNGREMVRELEEFIKGPDYSMISSSLAN